MKQFGKVCYTMLNVCILCLIWVSAFWLQTCRSFWEVTPQFRSEYPIISLVIGVSVAALVHNPLESVSGLFWFSMHWLFFHLFDLHRSCCWSDRVFVSWEQWSTLGFLCPANRDWHESAHIMFYSVWGSASLSFCICKVFLWFQSLGCWISVLWNVNTTDKFLCAQICVDSHS